MLVAMDLTTFDSWCLVRKSTPTAKLSHSELQVTRGVVEAKRDKLRCFVQNILLVSEMVSNKAVRSRQVDRTCFPLGFSTQL